MHQVLSTIQVMSDPDQFKDSSSQKSNVSLVLKRKHSESRPENTNQLKYTDDRNIKMPRQAPNQPFRHF